MWTLPVSDQDFDAEALMEWPVVASEMAVADAAMTDMAAGVEYLLELAHAVGLTSERISIGQD